MEVMAKKRPTSVTAIAWIIIIIGGLSLVITLLISTMPEVQQVLEAAGASVAVTVLWAIVGGAITLASGIAIFKGLNWGRLLYLYFTPISIVLGWLLYGFDPPDLLYVIFYIVILIFLTRSAASTFFASGND